MTINITWIDHCEGKEKIERLQYARLQTLKYIVDKM